jgi:predicted MFS family arabinose efflux permease
MSAPAFSPYQRFVVALLALLQFTVVLDFMVLSPLSDVLMKSMDISTKQFGWVVSAYAFSAGISGILAAGFADKFDRKKLLLFFYIGFIGGTAFCAMSNNYVMLLSARIVTGLFGGVIGAISMAIIADLFAVQQRGRVMGIVQMGFAVSQVLGIPAGLFFANNWGWHSSFWMIVILAILIAISIIWLLKPVTAHLSIQLDKSPFLHFWHTLQSRRYRTGFAATALLSVGGFMMMPFASVFLVNNIHIHHDDLPIIFLCTGIASIVIMPIVGRLSDKVNKFSLFVAGSALAMAMVLVYTNLVPVPLWAIILLNMVMFVGIMSRMVPAMSLVTAIPAMSDRGAFMSINSSLQQMAGGIAAIVAGAIVVQPAKEAALLHYPILGLVVVGAMLVCAIFVYRVSKLATDPAS